MEITMNYGADTAAPDLPKDFLMALGVFKSYALIIANYGRKANCNYQAINLLSPS